MTRLFSRFDSILKCLLLALLGLSSIAQSQDSDITIKLGRIQGGVMIDSKGQYKTVTTDTVVGSNTKILLQKSSSAQLTYPNGCTLNLLANKIYQPGDEMNCKQGAAILVAANDTAAVGAVGTSAKEAGEDNTGAWLLGAGALGAIGVAAAAGGGSSQQSPSPSH
jgi:hypothetical protein